jgi:molybdenum cofactor cytidylyltransferase
MNSVAAILLAAGRSERMGAFKPLLPFGDKTVIETCIDHLREGGVETIVVVLGHRANLMKKHLQDLNLSFACNPDPESEMSASIACGARQLPRETKVVLIALADHPAVGAEVISTIINCWKAGAKLVIPEYGGRGGHPVLVDVGFRDELLHLDPEHGLRSLFDGHRTQVQRIPVSSPFIARDMDTWDDYSALHEDVFGMAPPPDSASRLRPSNNATKH